MASLLESHIHAAPDAHLNIEQFGSPWAVAERGFKHLRRLPRGLLRSWAAQPFGHVIVGRHESRYEPAAVLWRDLRTRAAVFINTRHVIERSPAFWEPVGAWLDHWLGSGAASGGAPRLSDAGADRPSLLEETASRLDRVLDRRYAEEFLESTDRRQLFARGFAWMMIDQQALSVADPHLAKWFRSTLLNDGFWKQFEATKEV